MRKIGFVLAVLSTMSMTVLPVAPSYAATAAPEQSVQQTIANHATRGEAVIISQAQMNELATSNPALHAKLSAAYQTGTLPKLNKSEKAMLQKVTAANLDSFKAGQTAETWIIIAVVVVVLLLLWQPIVCKIFPWALGCQVAVGAPIRARG